ncbi:hypothetical protein [Variovorax saccharolyticus]|uniref:hypothetical protein n=1 Tax=Variovorax saccharolyticus TaxID=3053516 RepID=UPI002577BC5F|nr:hypothetical protein [Variovorax sp. J22R187]MDM0021430.1 hypothetical protein [Variovorax sp. J22R187]
MSAGEGAALGLGIGLALGALAKGAAAPPPAGQGDEALRESNRGLNAQNQQLRQTIDTLNAQILQLRRTIESLNARIAALGAADAAATSAHQKEQAQAAKTERDANQQQAANRALQGQVGELSKLIESLRAQAGNASTRLDQASQELSQAKADQARTAQALEAANQRIANREQEAQRQRNELAATSTRVLQFEDETRRLQAAFAAAQRERWSWAALFALLGAGLAAAAVRWWWPKPVQVVKPLSVSVGLGAWSLEAASPAAGPAASFQVRTQWLPVGSGVRPAGELVARPSLVAIHGEAA